MCEHSLLQYEIDTPLHRLIEKVGKEHAERAYQLCGEAITEPGTLAKKLDLSEFEFKKSLYFAAHALLWNTADSYSYLRVTDDNRILIGGREKRDQLMGPSNCRRMRGNYFLIWISSPN